VAKGGGKGGGKGPAAAASAKEASKAADAAKATEAAEAAFAFAKAAAAAQFRSGAYADAAAGFARLIAQCRGSGSYVKYDALTEAFTSLALPGLLSNRAMCYIEAGQLDKCVEDCEGALAALEALGAAASQAPKGLAFKVALRRAEARRRLGQLSQVKAESEALSAMAATEEERMAAEHLALQCAVISVD
jgi:hypothetical protein